jgi:hypothetical protein
MNLWFAKFKISNALDGGNRLPHSVRQKIAASESLRRFRDDSVALDRALRQAPRDIEVSPTLHGSIMRALRQPQVRAGRQTASFAWRWAPTTAVAALVLAGLFWPRPQPALPAHPDSLAPVANVLESSDKLARAVPAAVVSPLSDEWARVGRDLDDTEQFLVASLP